MLSLLPDLADPLRLCTLGKAYQGKLALAELPRISPLLASTEGEAAFALAFGTDEERRPVVSVSVQARLPLVCQRCLQVMYLDVDATSRLAVVAGPDEAERLPDDLDPLMADGDRLPLRSLVEDELILAIPPAPMHEAEHCAVSLEAWNQDAHGAAQPVDEADSVRDANPFAALAALKSDKREQD